MSFSESLTTATAYEVTDAPCFMAMEDNMRSPCDNSTASGVADENRENIRTSKMKKQILKLAAWNVRTTNDSVSNIRPERATAIICREREKAGIDICALSEVPGLGQHHGEKSHYLLERW